MSNSKAEIINHYQQEINEVTQGIQTTKKLIDKLSFARIGLFAFEVFLFVLLVSSNDDGWRTLIQFAILMPVIAFAIIVRKQSKLDAEAEYLSKLLWVFQNEKNVVEGKPNGYSDGADHELEWHPYSSDLDIFGKSSLYALINRCSTKNGEDLLAQKLSSKSNRQTILDRQTAVHEMQSKFEHTFSFRAFLKGSDNTRIENIKAQLSGQLGIHLKFTKNRFLRAYVLVVPYVSIVLLLGGIVLGGIFWKLFAAFAIVNTGWNILMNGEVNKVFYGFGGNSNLLNNYASAILWTENQNWKSKYILAFFNSKIPVSKEILHLSKIIQNFDARLNLLVGGVLNAFLLWDFRCSIRLDRWYTSASKDVISALDHLGDFEELISIATLAQNEPEWAFPLIEESFILETKSLGHPLIPNTNRITNDFNVEPTPTVDIVTGSNMAGKSTFLRTVGINLVLAYAGAPVCASEMTASVFALVTYMRIKDSLNESTSTFKAELNRLKMILDHVVRDKTTFVLIDEMLRGTNSRDKYLGSKVFVEKLIAEHTPALFATHDLQLADLKTKHSLTVRNFHFDIQLLEGEMGFDYKLKNGPCSTFNAAILLEQIGLKLDEQ